MAFFLKIFAARALNAQNKCAPVRFRNLKQSWGHAPALLAVFLLAKQFCRDPLLSPVAAASGLPSWSLSEDGNVFLVWSSPGMASMGQYYSLLGTTPGRPAYSLFWSFHDFVLTPMNLYFLKMTTLFSASCTEPWWTQVLENIALAWNHIPSQPLILLLSVQGCSFLGSIYQPL